MLEYEQIAEQRILDAIARGELENLPGSGSPLNLDDDALVPAELRLAYRVLKNAGYVPEEVRLKREISDLESMLRGSAESPEERRALRRLGLLKVRLAARSGRETAFDVESEYRRKILDVLAAPVKAVTKTG